MVGKDQIGRGLFQFPDKIQVIIHPPGGEGQIGLPELKGHQLGVAGLILHYQNAQPRNQEAIPLGPVGPQVG
jgi:hypothetical protein